VFRIETVNNIAGIGLARFPADRYAVGPTTDPDVILVRSASLHEREFGPALLALGRAGAGVNNIPVGRLTARGVPVFNAPGANANAVKELVIAGMLLASRHICQAWDFSCHLTGTDEELHKAVESGKKKFVGTEIAGKSLAVIGLGAIGRLVANAATALGLRVVGFDPAPQTGTAPLDAAVRRVEALDLAIAGADFVTVHVPLVAATRDLLNADRLASLAKGAVVLNFAREGIVNEAAVTSAIDAGHVRAYVSDFPTTRTKNHRGCITLPHLGASTAEAEDNCAVMVVDQIRAFLETGSIQNAVNFPDLQAPSADGARVVAALAGAPAGRLAVDAALAGAAIHPRRVVTAVKGDLTYVVLDLADRAEPAAAALLQRPGVVMARAI
jgi:D-3-phosphoglycerate dehydrogenase